MFLVNAVVLQGLLFLSGGATPGMPARPASRSAAATRCSSVSSGTGRGGEAVRIAGDVLRIGVAAHDATAPDDISAVALG